MTKVLITGGSGMVGSRIAEILGDKYEFESLSRQTGLNITQKEDVLKNFQNSDTEIVTHLAAKADVDGCESDKDADEKKLEDENTNWENSESAYGVNVYGASNIVDAANKTNKKLIYISTDFVFDGEREEPYAEEDIPNAINWYAKTKYLAEEDVRNKSNNFVIARIAYPYRTDFPKKDFMRAMFFRLKEGMELKAVTDHVMTPTFIDDIAFALDKLILENQSGIYHVVGSSFVSPFDAANKIAEIFGFDKNLISKITRDEFFKGRAPRPFHLALKNAKIAELGIKTKTFEEGLFEIKKQI